MLKLKDQSITSMINLDIKNKGGYMKKSEIDGMRYPSIDDLLKVIDSKYKLAYVASKTAKLIEKYKNIELTNVKCQKSVGQAREEVINGHVKVEFKK